MRKQLIEVLGAALAAVILGLLTMLFRSSPSADTTPPMALPPHSAYSHQESTRAPLPAATSTPPTASLSTPPRSQLDPALRMIYEVLLANCREAYPPIAVSLTAESITLARESDLVRLRLDEIRRLNIHNQDDLNARIEVIRNVESRCAEKFSAHTAQIDCAILALEPAELSLAAAFLFAQEPSL